MITNITYNSTAYSSGGQFFFTTGGKMNLRRLRSTVSRSMAPCGLSWAWRGTVRREVQDARGRSARTSARRGSDASSQIQMGSLSSNSRKSLNGLRFFWNWRCRPTAPSPSASRQLSRKAENRGTAYKPFIDSLCTFLTHVISCFFGATEIIHYNSQDYNGNVIWIFLAQCIWDCFRHGPCQWSGHWRHWTRQLGACLHRIRRGQGWSHCQRFLEEGE